MIQSINKNSSTSSSIFQDADSPILTSNVLLLGADQKQNVATPQGSQPFDWSKRQKFKNRFRLFKSNPTTSTTSSTIITKKSITEIPSTTTGKSMSEALIFASSNPQYDNRLFIELPVQYMKIPSSEHGENMRRTCCVQKLFFVFVLTFRTTYVHNMFYPCSPNVLSMF